MLVSEKVAIAAHLHVLLRRKTGRVTDTEWMAENLDYAREVIRFARAKALEDGHTELAEWADKLEIAVLQPSAPGRVSIVRAAAQLLDAPLVAVEPAAEPAPAGPRYIGGIR